MDVDGRREKWEGRNEEERKERGKGRVVPPLLCLTTAYTITPNLMTPTNSNLSGLSE